MILNDNDDELSLTHYLSCLVDIVESPTALVLCFVVVVALTQTRTYRRYEDRGAGIASDAAIDKPHEGVEPRVCRDRRRSPPGTLPGRVGSIRPGVCWAGRNSGGGGYGINPAVGWVARGG